MIKDKLLIFHSYFPNINCGGPSGFLAHNLIGYKGKNYLLSSELKKKNNFFSKILLKTRLEIFKVKKSSFSVELEKILYLYLNCKCSDYKIIFFHTCLELYACKNLLRENQIVILQSHSPELPSEELEEMGHSCDDVSLMREIEKFSFDRAQYIVFPNEGCIPLYEKIYKNKMKTQLLLSGSKQVNDIIEYPLDKTKINLLYVGRRNSIKGFDIVLENFTRVYEKRKDIRLIVIGKGDKIEIEGVIDLGFSPTPLNWYKSVDYVINSNRQSYFDLSILEVLSIGTPIIMIPNFGHTFFEGKSKGIITFNGLEKKLDDVLINLKRNESEKIQMINQNLKLYNSLLSDTHYRERLEVFSEKIINDLK